jgi:hypothetical protein
MEEITLTRRQAEWVALCLGKAIAEGAFRNCEKPDVGDAVLDMISAKLAALPAPSIWTHRPPRLEPCEGGAV